MIEGIASGIARGIQVGGNVFSPRNITNLVLWFKNLIIPLNQQNTAGFQINNEGTAPDLKLFSGPGIEFVSSNSDKADLGNLGTIYGVEFWIELASTTEKVLDLNGTANIEVVSGTVTVNNWTGTSIKVDDAVSSTLDTTLKHVFITSATGISASAVVAGLISATYGDFKMKDLIFYTSEPTKSNYNTPQNLLSVENAIIVPFSDVVYENSDSVTVVNGTDGTFSTAASAGYDAGVFGLSEGFQLALHNYNIVSSRFILSETPYGETDLDGNAITNPIKPGMLNFLGKKHLGGQIGTTVDSLDMGDMTIFAVFKYVDNGDFQILITNRVGGDGFSFYINKNNDRIIFWNEVGRIATTLSGTTNLTTGNYYAAAVKREADGTTNIYLADLTAGDTTLTSDATEASTGVIGNGSQIPTITIVSDDTLPFAGQSVEKASFLANHITTTAEDNRAVSYARKIIGL